MIRPIDRGSRLAAQRGGGRLASRLSQILINQRVILELPGLVLSSGRDKPSPRGLDPERVVTIKRVFIDPPEEPAEQLPEIVEPSPAIEHPSPQTFNRPLPTPRLGIV